MAKHRIKKEDHRSIVRVGCAIMTLVNSHYVWTCSVTNQVILKQDILHMSNSKYEAKADKRLQELKDALEKHSHVKHR